MNSYHIYEEIGKGKYSIVYKVFNLNLIYFIRVYKGPKEKKHRIRGRKKLRKIPT